MAPLQIQIEHEVEALLLAANERLGPGNDAQIGAGAGAMATVEDSAIAVQCDRHAQAIGLDGGAQLGELRRRHWRNEVGEWMDCRAGHERLAALRLGGAASSFGSCASSICRMASGRVG